MGDIYGDDDDYIESHLAALNLRFAPGDPLDEMVHLQSVFKIFSGEYRLEDCISLLNVTGDAWQLRAKWYKLWNWIAGLTSDQPGKSGGEAIIDALRHELESAKPRPVYFQSHNFDSNPNVQLNLGIVNPVFYIKRQYVTISIPLRSKR
jgi:hypothetical protein